MQEQLERPMTEEEREKAFQELDAVMEVLLEQEYSCALLEHDILELKGIHWQAVLESESMILGEEERAEREKRTQEIDTGIERLEQRLAKAQGSVASFREKVRKLREALLAQKGTVPVSSQQG